MFRFGLACDPPRDGGRGSGVRFLRFGLKVLEREEGNLRVCDGTVEVRQEEASMAGCLAGDRMEQVQSCRRCFRDIVFCRLRRATLRSAWRRAVTPEPDIAQHSFGRAQSGAM